DPILIVADEAVSSLDMSARGQILNLLLNLQHTHSFTCVHVSHDLSLIRHICDRVVVMYAGRIVEDAPIEEIVAEPRHPYTQSLISASPTHDEAPVYVERAAASTRLPAERGCPFSRRCPIAQEICVAEEPDLRQLTPSHRSACHFADEIGASPPVAIA